MKSQRRAKKNTVLVIEDNADHWFLIRWVLLQRFPGVEAVWMAEPVQALDYLETCSPDKGELPKLLLLDLYLPRPDIGWNTIQIIKNHYLYRDIPTIVLSQSSAPEDIEQSYRCHANLYIVKPKNYEDWLRCFTSLRQSWWDKDHLPPGRHVPD